MVGLFHFVCGLARNQLWRLKPALSQEPQSKWPFGNVFRGGANRDQQMIRGLTSQVHELEAKCQEIMKKKKQEHLAKWDWLENQYQLKCHAAYYAQQSLKKAQDELRETKETMMQRINELESARNVSVEVRVHVIAR